MTRETRPGPAGPVTLSSRVWALLEDAYAAAGLDPSTYLVVTQGSWSDGSLSGSTHSGGGAFDLRTWNLPERVRRDLCRELVVPLRERCGLAVWFRDETHGGFAPHIHGIVRDEPELGSGAAWQVSDADAGRNGLSGSANGPDYHPRPAYRGFTYPRTLTERDGRMIFRTHADSKPDGQGVGAGQHYLVLPNGSAVLMQSGYVAEGLPVVQSATEQTDRAFRSAAKIYNGDGGTQ